MAHDDAAAAGTQDEPDLLRDQFRQLLRYRGMLVLGLVLGLVGGAWVAFSGGTTYTSTSEVTIRQVSFDPFSPGGSAADKAINVGTERQTAISNSVANLVAKDTGYDGDIEALQAGLQITNPPNTLVLRISYSADSSSTAAKRANAFAHAYLEYRQKQVKDTIDRMVGAYNKQLEPLKRERDKLDKQIAGLSEGLALDSALSSRSSLSTSMTEITADRNKLIALDNTPGNVVRTATPPKDPSGPRLPMLLALGAAVGLGLGLLAAWVRLVFDPAARSEGDVVRALRAPVLGTLPRGSGEGPLLADGREAEEYRSMAFRLAYDARFADRRRLLVVAPRGSSETAAAVSVNLAASFVEMGHEVLLVEADLRAPTLQARLSAADGVRPGWARTPARSDGGWPTGLQIPIDAGESGAFDLIPGTRVRNAARALTSAPATQLIASADAPGSVVVVLAPPLLSYADAIALADRVDGVLVVCDPREVHREDLARIRELIDGAGGTVLGSVLHSFRGHAPRTRRGGGGSRRAGKEGEQRRGAPADPGPGPAGRAGDGRRTRTTPMEQDPDTRPIRTPR